MDESDSSTGEINPNNWLYCGCGILLSKLWDGTAKDNVGLLNMVLLQGATRFIVPILNSNPADESRLLDLIERSKHRVEGHIFP